MKKTLPALAAALLCICSLPARAADIYEGEMYLCNGESCTVSGNEKFDYMEISAGATLIVPAGADGE